MTTRQSIIQADLNVFLFYTGALRQEHSGGVAHLDLRLCNDLGILLDGLCAVGAVRTLLSADRFPVLLHLPRLLLQRAVWILRRGLDSSLPVRRTRHAVHDTWARGAQLGTWRHQC